MLGSLGEEVRDVIELGEAKSTLVASLNATSV